MMPVQVSRRGFLSNLAAAPVGATLSAGQRLPNFVVILSDDQGYRDVGCYGSEIPTPHIDSIAGNGVKFTNFYVAGPVCTPSRYGLLTGRYPARSRDRLLGALMPGTSKGIHPGETTIAEALKARGYRTAIFGKWHLGYAKPEFLPTRRGFDQFDGFVHGCIDFFDFTYGGLESWYRNEKLHRPARGYTTDYITDQALSFLRENRDKPFFLYLPHNAPHYGKTGYDPATKQARNALQAPPEYTARFAHLADETRRLYAAMVSSLDDNVGRLLKALRDLKLDDNTLVVFLSDNGGSIPYGGRNEPLRGQKGELFEGGIRVPCLMQCPGRLKAGAELRQAAGGVDLFPTLAALAGAPVPAGLDGRDLSPALFRGSHLERELFWRTGNADACLVWNAPVSPSGGAPGSLPAGSGRRARRQPHLGYWKYIKTSEGREFLFDLETDPGETVNRADNELVLRELRRVHRRILSRLGA